MSTRLTPAALQEFSIQKVLAMLDDAPTARLAVITDDGSHNTIATIAIRGLAAFEMEIPREKYDGFAMMELIDKHTRQIE
jgi:hypothetical protein